jgi:uncharacterized membrane protein YgdD (TMEM256/DUF423 family)
MVRFWFITGCLLAGLGVAAGAFGAHALKQRLSIETLQVFETGVRYQMYHAFGLLVVALAMDRWPNNTIHIAGWLFLAGIVLFSGSLYALCLSGIRTLGAITPIGGLCFLSGWAFLALAIWTGRS